MSSLPGPYMAMMMALALGRWHRGGRSGRARWPEPGLPVDPCRRTWRRAGAPGTRAPPARHRRASQSTRLPTTTVAKAAKSIYNRVRVTRRKTQCLRTYGRLRRGMTHPTHSGQPTVGELREARHRRHAILTTVDEYDLRRMRPSPGFYAFHLRALRAATVGLRGRGPFDHDVLTEARGNVLAILDRMLALAGAKTYQGDLHESHTYQRHGTVLRLTGGLAHTRYLHSTIERMALKDLPAFVASADALSTFLPPVYVGIVVEQTLLDRYGQHKLDHARKTPGTFGQRLAEHGFHWSDVLFSCAPQARVGPSAIRALEDYLHYFSRPPLGIT